MKFKAMWHGVTRAAKSLRLVFQQSRQSRAADELRAMDERELRDIAIGRGEIPYVLARKR